MFVFYILAIDWQFVCCRSPPGPPAGTPTPTKVAGVIWIHWDLESYEFPGVGDRRGWPVPRRDVWSDDSTVGRSRKLPTEGGITTYLWWAISKTFQYSSYPLFNLILILDWENFKGYSPQSCIEMLDRRMLMERWREGELNLVSIYDRLKNRFDFLFVYIFVSPVFPSSFVSHDHLFFFFCFYRKLFI